MTSFNGYTRDQICQLLNISPRTLKRRVRANEIRMIKVQGSYLYYPPGTDVPGANGDSVAPLAPLAQATRDNGLGQEDQVRILL